MILSEGAILVGLGLLLGIVGAFIATRVMRGLLFEVAPHDPVTFVAVALLMTGVGVLACWFPAHRAARIDPAIAMRT
jgi:ABC-type antimicrobial peptide transport system permease subunit